MTLDNCVNSCLYLDFKCVNEELNIEMYFPLIDATVILSLLTKVFTSPFDQISNIYINVIYICFKPIRNVGTIQMSITLIKIFNKDPHSEQFK
jgi:hypothetical protein